LGLVQASLPLIYRLPPGVERRVLFVIVHHRLPHFGRPVTFSDKINWRILNDRRPLLAWTCDKLAMKQYALTQVPDGLTVPRTIWSGSDVRDLAAADLPEHWVLKPNHRSSGLVYFGTGRPDLRELAAVTATWLKPFEARRLREWAYSQARPMLLAEELMGTPGTPPPDYKFFVFDGTVGAVELHTDRYARHQARLYRPDWSPLDVVVIAELAPVAPLPPNLDRMLKIAARLGRPFDFMRVDLYDDDDVVKFGELTPYPCSGLGRFDPASFDTELGKAWTLPALGTRAGLGTEVSHHSPLRGRRRGV
jgi:TupA-like ATPgrasp